MAGVNSELTETDFVARAARCVICITHRFLDIEVRRLQHALDHIRTIESVAELRNWIEIRHAVVAVVDVPADQFVRSEGGIVVTLRRPHDPALAVGMDE